MPGQKHQPEKYKKKHSKKADSRLMQERGEKRSGSDSDAHSGRKRSRLHEDHKDENTPLYEAQPDVDLARGNTPGAGREVYRPQAAGAGRVRRQIQYGGGCS